jgi:hypothetical protein
MSTDSIISKIWSFCTTLRDDSVSYRDYLEKYSSELGKKSYELLSGKRLKDIKLSIQSMNDPEIDFGIIKHTSRLGVFDFNIHILRITDIVYPFADIVLKSNPNEKHIKPLLMNTLYK